MNPEFQRNLWLEASPRRIAWAAVTLALVYGATAALSRNNPGGAMVALGVVGSAVFVVCGLIWGARAAANSVLSEIADRTWDFQRLSALDAWTMTWGKLLGGPSLAWLCGLTGLVLILATGVQGGTSNMLATLGFLIGLAVLLHAVSLGAALIGVRKARAEGRTARAGGVLGGLIVGAILLSWAAGSAGFQRGAGVEGLGALWNARGFIDWGGRFWPAAEFRTVVVILLAAWAVAGAWRLMRLELQMRNAPLVWPASLVFLAVLMGGFAYGREGWAGAFTVGALAVALAAYAAAFAEPADKIRMRQFAHHLGRGDLGRAAPLVPAPVSPVLLAALLVAAALAAGAGSSVAFGVGQAAALLAFVVRDLGVIAYCRMGARPQRGDFGAVVALGLLYGVGAALGLALGGEAGVALMIPSGDLPLISLASGLVQAALAWLLAAMRIREGSISAPPSAPASAPV